MSWLKRIRLAFWVFIITACSSGPKTMILPDMDGASSADGAAYTADSMHFRRPMPSHADWRPIDFYFKHCTEIGDGPYYSKTSYECTIP